MTRFPGPQKKGDRVLNDAAPFFCGIRSALQPIRLPGLQLSVSLPKAHPGLSGQLPPAQEERMLSMDTFLALRENLADRSASRSEAVLMACLFSPPLTLRYTHSAM